MYVDNYIANILDVVVEKGFEMQIGFNMDDRRVTMVHI